MHWFYTSAFDPKAWVIRRNCNVRDQGLQNTTKWKQQAINNCFFFRARPCVVLKNHPNGFFQDPGENTLMPTWQPSWWGNSALPSPFLLLTVSHSCDVWIIFLGILYYLHKGSCLNHSFWGRAQLRGKAFIGGSCISRFQKHCFNYLCLTV